MKNMKTIMTGLLLGTALFTACKKDNSLTPANQLNQNQRTITDGSLIRMNTAYAVNSTMTITSNGKTMFVTDGMTKTNLNQYLVSGYNIYPASYQNLEITLRSVPERMSPSVIMRGEYVTDAGESVPVEIRMLRPVMMYYRWDKYPMMDATTVGNLLNINWDRVAANISSDMLMSAKMDNGVIVISEEMNPDLFRMITDNLMSMFKLVFLTTVPTPTPTPVPTSDLPQPQAAREL
jgi:hypothetical protein